MHQLNTDNIGVIYHQDHGEFEYYLTYIDPNNYSWFEIISFKLKTDTILHNCQIYTGAAGNKVKGKYSFHATNFHLTC